MAKTISISTKENTANIVVDGNEISGVISYNLIEDSNGARLTVEILITDRVEVQR